MVTEINLGERLGLPAKLNLETGRIRFGVSVGREVTRTLREAVETGVIYSADNIPNRYLDKIVTIIYRFINDDEVRSVQGIAIGSDIGVKFDVTVLLPYTNFDKDWQWEFPKTLGHYHSKIHNLSVASPDFYQVVYGKGKLLLQKQISESMVSYIVDPEVLEPVIVPPGLGHIAINIGEEPLVFANVCVRQPHLDYTSMWRFRGGTHFWLRNSGGQVQTVINREYLRHGYSIGEIIPMRVNSTIPELSIEKGKPLYEYIRENGRAIEMLCMPDRYMHIFSTSLISRPTLD